MSGVPADEITAKDFIMVRAALVRRLGGANEALVWARVHYRCDEDSRVAHDTTTGRWWAASYELVGAEVGLSAKQARNALEKLVDDGYLEREQHALRNNYDRVYSYRPVVKPGMTDLPSGADGSDQTGTSHLPSGANHHLPSGANAPIYEKEKTLTKTGGAAKRGTRIPQPFVVTPEMVVWAREHAPLVDGPRSTQRFENYWLAKSGRDAVKLDWVRTWRNWLLKDQEDAERRQGGKKSPTDRALATLALAKPEQAAVSA